MTGFVAPGFWNADRRAPGLAARMLSPLAAIWGWETARRLRRGAWHRAGAPVICIGNLTAGGTGKTPVAIHVLEHLRAAGIDAHALSRGYGGAMAGPVRVDPALHRAADTGDEPLLLAAFAPAWVARDRRAGAGSAVAAGAQAIVMDDGFQNPSLAKDLSILVVDAALGFGNGRVIPAGPMREPLGAGLARADLVVSVGPPPAQDRLSEAWPELTRLPRVRATLAPLPTGMPWDGLRVLAFAGIARPQKFFATLEGLGARIMATRSFADHAPYPPAVLTRLAREAKSLKAQLVTTEKDAVRLPDALRAQVLTLPVRLQPDPADGLEAHLRRIIDAVPAR